VLGIRVEASYFDGKGYNEKILSTNSSATAVTLGAGNTAPTLIAGTQFHGIPNTTATVGQPFDLFSPFNLIFTDVQTPVIAAAPGGPTLTFTAVAVVGNIALPLSSVGLQFSFDPTTGVAEFSTLPVLDPKTGLPVLDAITGLPVLTALTTPGPIDVRVTATDPQGLAVTNTFVINVASTSSGAPVAVDDSYTGFKGVAMTVLPSGSVLNNDSDPNLDPFTGSMVTGPAHGTLAFNADGSSSTRAHPSTSGWIRLPTTIPTAPAQSATPRR
jgi:hypothetical protein